MGYLFDLVIHDRDSIHPKYHERRALLLYFAKKKGKGGPQELVFSQGHPPCEGRTWDPSQDRSDSQAHSGSFLWTVVSHMCKQL